MRRDQLFTLFFLLAFGFLLYQFYKILSGFIGPLSYAALLAFVLWPARVRLCQWLGGRTGVTAGLMTLGTLVLVVAPAFYLLTTLTRESISLYDDVRVFVTSGRLHELLESLRSSRIGQFVHDLLPRLRTELPRVAVSASQTVSGFLVAQAPEAAANVFRFIVNFFFAIFTMFFFFRDGDRMVGAVRDLIPMEEPNKDAVVSRFAETLSAVVLGSVLTAVAQGVLGGVMYAALGVPFAALLAGATAFFSLLPFGGPVVWVAVTVYLVLTGDYVRAGIMAGWGTIVISSVDNLIRPLVIGGRTQIPTVVLFFGILGGIQVYGFLGVFLGPAVIAMLVAFARIYRDQFVSDTPRSTPPPAAI
ncbi:MAG: AI-2E family transporter [Candidatus Binatia bacterium]